MPSDQNQYNPEEVSSPWETVMDWAEENERMVFHPTALKAAIEDKPITESIAITLERITGIPSAFWIKREANYRKWKEKNDAK